MPFESINNALHHLNIVKRGTGTEQLQTSEKLLWGDFQRCHQGGRRLAPGSQMRSGYHLSLSIPDAWLLLDCCFLPRATVAAWSFTYSGTKWRLRVTAVAWTFPVFSVKNTNTSSLGRFLSVCTSMQTDSVAGKEVFLGLLSSLLKGAQCWRCQLSHWIVTHTMYSQTDLRVSYCPFHL